ncbi:MAG: nitroreductase family deazaflavin-dependent oxidoreductase [Acidimicrobiia bacterium]|nr:nitroreductase family deazaflavin-dependent oxidoreductase [Acidimicrobiia bacterium]
MSLVADLGIELHQPNTAEKLARSLGSSRVGAMVFSKTLHHIDRLTGRIGNGSHTMTEVTTGLPTIELTSTGAKSGQLRTSPLIAIPFDGNVAVVGSGWGTDKTPAWVFNLRANRQADISFPGRSATVKARELVDDERDLALAAAIAIHAGYAEYPRRASHRHIAVFCLEPQ